MVIKGTRALRWGWEQQGGQVGLLSRYDNMSWLSQDDVALLTCVLYGTVCDGEGRVACVVGEEAGHAGGWDSGCTAYTV